MLAPAPVAQAGGERRRGAIDRVAIRRDHTSFFAELV